MDNTTRHTYKTINVQIYNTYKKNIHTRYTKQMLARHTNKIYGKYYKTYIQDSILKYVLARHTRKKQKNSGRQNILAIHTMKSMFAIHTYNTYNKKIDHFCKKSKRWSAIHTYNTPLDLGVCIADGFGVLQGMYCTRYVLLTLQVYCRAPRFTDGTFGWEFCSQKIRPYRYATSSMKCAIISGVE